MKNLSQEEMKKIISDVVSDYKKNNDIDISIRLVTKKEFYQELAKSSQVYYIDFTDELADKYDLFFNSTHLNVRGQELYTQRLIRELKPILFDNEGNKLH